MGYYTRYSLSFLNGTEKEQDEITKEIVNISGEEDFKSGYATCKWYNCEEDIIEISKKYPEVIIELTGDGEESEDVWEARFLNGDMEFHTMQMPPFEHIGVELNQ